MSAVAEQNQSNQTDREHTRLLKAIACPHAIDTDSVTLRFDPKQPGHNALNQLSRRLNEAIRDDQEHLTDDQFVSEHAARLIRIFGNPHPIVESLGVLPGAAQDSCWCETCRPITISDMRMVLCPSCGNKRCPHATDHRNSCSGSNEPGQPGSSWANVKPHPRAAVPDDPGLGEET